MRRPRDVALRAGFYLVAAVSGVAAAYVLREWINRLWDVPRPLPSDDEDPSDAHPSDETSQARSLPPLRTHSLPLPLPNAHALLSGPFVSINPSSTPPQTTHVSLNDDECVDEDAAQSTSSESDSLVDVMSPHPPHVISKRRSMRAHDLFAESHISFSELGSLVAPQNKPE